MIKYINMDVVFQEIPEETTLALNISNCPCHCPGCHSKYLWGDIGTILDYNEIYRLINKYTGFITCICFMGGDNDPVEINNLATYIKNNFDIKIGWYSGRQELSKHINISNFNYIKLGPYIKERGGLDNPNTNQKIYEYNKYYSDYTIGKSWRDITYKFWKS